MQYTDHYNLNLPEGTDIVNPLVQDNPNYTKIDTALYNNKLRVVGNATEVKSGTTHAITRSDSDIDVIRFTATGDWITGDSMTVDGNPVTVVLQDGTAPLTGAYIINTEVMAILNGTRVTLYGAQKLPEHAASDVTYDNSVSGLPASNVQVAIDKTAEIANDAKAAAIRGGVSVVADGVKTYRQLLDDLYSLADLTKITPNSNIRISSDYFQLTYKDSTRAYYGQATVTDMLPCLTRVQLLPSNSVYDTYRNNAYSTRHNNVPGSGIDIRLNY